MSKTRNISPKKIQLNKQEYGFSQKVVVGFLFSH